MITPSLQSNPSTLSLKPGKHEESVRFGGRNIRQLPADVLLAITRYLSMHEVLVLGQVCRDLRSNLQRCGVITDIWNYLSLPKNIKRYVHRLVTGNRLLIDHLRNNPVGYRKSFPIQYGPAIYTKYASHFREHVVRASSITLLQSGCIDESTDLLFYNLNYQHNCLIRDDVHGRRLYVWTNQKNGSWEREGMIDYGTDYIEDRRHGTDILIIGEKEDGKFLLSIAKRNDVGKWNVAQKLCLNDISRLLENHEIFQIHLAENQQVILCEVVNPDTRDVAVLIFGMDDGRWQTTGKFHLCEVPYSLQFRFSQDCRHVAVLNDETILFISRQDDGYWRQTGELDPDYPVLNEKNFEFSSDNRHFVAWGEQDQIRSDGGPLRTDPLVLVASLDDQGYWSEVLMLNRPHDLSILKSSSYARFSLDVKQLFVCINNQLNILSLREDEWVSSTQLLEPWDGSRCQIMTTMNPSLFMVTSDSTAWIYAIDASGTWGKQHEFSFEFSPKISSDGDTVICHYGKVRQIDIWSRRHPDQWIKQEFAIPATCAEFNPDGSLVALASGHDLIFLGLTEKGQWQEKGRQKFDRCVGGLCFSPCGRSIRVDFHKGEDCVITFWQIVLHE